MPTDPQQGELPLEIAPQVLDGFVLSARLCATTPEVEYRLTWQTAGSGDLSARIFLDAMWPIEKMSARIIAMLDSAHSGKPWKWRTVMAVLNVLVSAYGCEEPF